MPDNLHFSIEFYKTRNKIDISNELAIDEQHEATEKALFVIESLVFFYTEAGKSDDIPEYSVDETRAHHRNFSDLINSFLVAAHSGLDQLEERRKYLEDLLPKLSKGLNKKAKKSETEFSQNLTIPDE